MSGLAEPATAVEDRRDDRDHDLGGHGDDREVLDRVRRRLDEQVQVEPETYVIENQKVDSTPFATSLSRDCPP